LGGLLTVAGEAMLIAGAAIILAALAATAPRALCARRRLIALRRAVWSVSNDITEGLNLLASRRDDARSLVAPWQRIWRVARHPLVAETLKWYMRRGRARA
jgi:hypothetical protein